MKIPDEGSADCGGDGNDDDGNDDHDGEQRWLEIGR